MNESKYLIILLGFVFYFTNCSDKDKKLCSEQSEKELLINHSYKERICFASLGDAATIACDKDNNYYFGKSETIVEIEELENLILEKIAITKDSTVEFHGDGRSDLINTFNVIEICDRNQLTFILKRRRPKQ
jgi:hypothetical protein